MQYFVNILIGFMVGVISQGLVESEFVLMIFSFLLMIIIASTSGKDFLIKAAIFSFIGVYIGYNIKGNVLNGLNFREDYMLWAKIAIQASCLTIGTYLVKSSVQKSRTTSTKYSKIYYYRDYFRTSSSFQFKR